MTCLPEVLQGNQKGWEAHGCVEASPAEAEGHATSLPANNTWQLCRA